MKKTWIITAVLMMLFIVLCTACGDSADGGKPSLPSVTAPPSVEGGIAGILAADDNSAPGQISREDWLAGLSAEQRLVEEKLRGAPVEELYEAIGEPISVYYVTSCMVSDGQDGILTYDGFFVSTTRLSNGMEYINGTGN